jgi:hypothetical protein
LIDSDAILIFPVLVILENNLEVLSQIIFRLFFIINYLSILIDFKDFSPKLSQLLIIIYTLLEIMVDHHNTLGFVVPAKVLVEPNDTVIVVTGEERISEACIHHVN